MVDQVSSRELFSIVIPAYNYGHTLRRAVESVLRQPGDDYELLVVNDGSIDDTAGVLARLETDYPGRFRWENRQNAGLAATRNYGVDQTRGRYLIFLDADDALCDDGLTPLRRAVNDTPGVGMVVGGHISVDLSGHEKVYLPKDLPTDRRRLVADYLLTKKIRLANGAVAMHRGIFTSYRYPERFRKAEDLSMFSYVLANFPTVCAKGVVSRIYKHEDSLRHNVELDKIIGLQLVDEVFDPKRLPEHFQDLKKKYMVQRLLSLSRTCFLSGDNENCRVYFLQAMRFDWTVAFRGSYIRHFIKAYFC